MSVAALPVSLRAAASHPFAEGPLRIVDQPASVPTPEVLVPPEILRSPALHSFCNASPAPSAIPTES